ncbi:hypothetical protein [Sphingobium cloacae]|uniref:Cytochrome c n=1 Tax=Sphingobium cloacae TaxID=120107 RepID=A0A1E1EYK6_9SPHN|nr:hypothetical protein [Sphingobium cloacae]BAV63338.1 hypothetical protein SCLO_1002980 [Sphingobium cloacae]
MTALAMGAALVGGCDRKADPSPVAEPADTHELMVGKIEPAAKVYWNAVKYISDENGLHEIMPRTDADWVQTREAAESVGRYADLMLTPAYAQYRGQDWHDFAKGLSDVAARAAEAAESRKADKVLELGGMMYNVCSACHEVYLPLAGSQPPTAGPDAP